jgi:hypothetical protein
VAKTSSKAGTVLLLAGALLGGTLAAPHLAASTADNGTFRFLTQSLPDGSTNSEYVARLLAANADGTVTFGATGLPTGLAADAQSGFITGRPTTTFNGNVTVTATDGTNNLNQMIHLKVSAAGGGGNAGATFDVGTLPDGEVGTAYTTTLTVSNGVGPYTYGAADLPPGLSLDGQAGTIAGTPQAAGTFLVSLTVYDAGDGNKEVKVVPLLVLPAGSDFQFTTKLLNNGEVGTVYWDQWLTSGGGAGSVAFGASGLPAGLSVDSSTGEVGGTPTVAGTYLVRISATKGGITISTNLTTVIAPSPTSSMYWDFFGVPTGLVSVGYQRVPPILVAVKGNVGTVTYAAIGLPSGMTYSSTSGELSGTPSDVGEYPMTFTATDGTSGEVVTLSVDFVVLPAAGGDPSQISVNLWVSKEVLKPAVPGSSSWTGSAIWNADRRTGNVFDPATDTIQIEIGSHVLTVDPGSMTGTVKKYVFASPKGVTPVLRVQLSPMKQTLKWVVKGDTIAESVPSTLRHAAILGGRGYRLDEAFDAKGIFKPALAYRRRSFVASKGAIAAGVAGKDSVKLSLLLGDPAFTYDPGVSVLRFRMLDGATVLLDRDFTLLGTGSQGTDKATGAPVYSVKSLKDTATVDRVAKFAFASAKGKMSLALSNVTLLGVPAAEAHLGIELTVGSNIYFTTVTFFEGKPGHYSTTMPAK